MPVIVESFQASLPEVVSQQLARVYLDSPEFEGGEAAVAALAQALAEGATLYTGLFNARHIAAVLAQGQGPVRQLRYLCVHSATRGRGVAERLMYEARRLEGEQGAQYLEADFNLSQEGVPEMLLALGFIPHGQTGLYRARL